MNIGSAIAIFKNINNQKFTEQEKSEAIVKILKMETLNSVTKEELRKAFIYAIENFDEVTEDPFRWIPVTERLPDKEGDYLVAHEHDGKIRIVQQLHYWNGIWNAHRGMTENAMSVDYWAPIPGLEGANE